MRRLLLLATLALAGCLSPIVGAECADGFTRCGRECVDLAQDPNHCGTCEQTCPDFCVAGECSATPGCGDGPGQDPCDAGPIDGGGDGPIADASADGPIADAAPLVDAAPLPDALVCTPLSDCGGTCVDVVADPDHCGVCGNSCASGICVTGNCLAGSSGHVVIIGHDYRRPRVGMNRLLGNSVFLDGDPVVDVLAYTLRSSAQVVSGADVAINQVSAEVGRGWAKTVANSATAIRAGLATADVLLIYSQDTGAATDGELVQLGNDLSADLTLFLARNGVVIVLDGVAPHGGTYQVAQAAGLFVAGGRTTVTGQTLDVVGPGNTVGANVPLTYAAEQTSVSFDTSESTQVVLAPNNQPVVIHRIVR